MSAAFPKDFPNRIYPLLEKAGPRKGLLTQSITTNEIVLAFENEISDFGLFEGSLAHTTLWQLSNKIK